MPRGIFRDGPRRTTLPRARPSPEHNVIQNPALTRAVQRFTGLRQAHIAPALGEGVQPTIMLGDVREDPRNVIAESYASFIEQVPGPDVARAVFFNPVGNDRVAVLRRLHVYAAPEYGPGVRVDLIYSNAPQEGVVFNGTSATLGKRLVSGYEWCPVGAVSRLLPDGIADFPWNPKPGTVLPHSKCGWHTPMIVPGIDGQYWWRGLFEGDTLEEFNSATGPRFFVFPGGTFHAYLLDATAHVYWNMWWDEYPIK